MKLLEKENLSSVEKLKEREEEIRQLHKVQWRSLLATKFCCQSHSVNEENTGDGTVCQHQCHKFLETEP